MAAHAFLRTAGDQLSHTIDDVRGMIVEFFEHWKIASEGIINLAFIPAFMSLRIMHKFDFLPKIPNLKSFPLDAFPTWRQIERQISR